MQLDRKNLVCGGIGAIMGACSVMTFNALSDDNNVISSFYESLSHRGKASMYDRVEADADGDVFITTKGKKYHRRDCYMIRQSDEVKQATRSAVAGVGYTPCKKCRP